MSYAGMVVTALEQEIEALINKVAVLEAALKESEEAERELRLAYGHALLHAVYRNHEYSTTCDACQHITEVMKGIETRNKPRSPGASFGKHGSGVPPKPVK